MKNFDSATGLAKGSFGIGTYSQGKKKPFPGIVLPDGAVIDVSDRYYDTHAIFNEWEKSFDILFELAEKNSQ